MEGDYGNMKMDKNPSEVRLLEMSIEEYLDRLVDAKMEARSRYKMLKEYYSGDIPKNVDYKFRMDPFDNYVLENLQTHDADMLVRKIEERFMAYRFVDVSKTRNRKRYISLRVLFEWHSKEFVRNLVNSESLKRLIEFFGYTLSSYYETDEWIEMHIDPTYAESADDFVYGECKAKLYHIAIGDAGERIEKTGLRIKDPSSATNKETYRDYPRRIYFIGMRNQKGNVLKSPEFQEVLLSFFSEEDLKKGITIFEVNVNHSEIDFYRDSASENNGINYAVYCYSNIPKERIRKIDGNVDDILNRM